MSEEARLTASKPIQVVGAAVIQDDKLLCAKRGPQMSMGGYWEFPGGKIEPGESAEEALVREIKEELGCEIRVVRSLHKNLHHYEAQTIELEVFWCELNYDVPQKSEHAELRWVPVNEIKDLTWAPADVPAVNKLAAD